MVLRCAAITKGGSRCTVPVMRGAPYCWVHAPEMTEARREASRRGGKARSAQARAAKLIPPGMDVAELHGRLSALFIATVSGATSPKVALAAAGVARVLLEAAREAQQPTIDELSEQLAVLRQMIERQSHGPAA